VPAVPGTSVPGDTAATGGAGSPARGDHRHGREGFATVAELAAVAAGEDAGLSGTVPRGDHVHAHGTSYLPNAHHSQAHDHSLSGDGQTLIPNLLRLANQGTVTIATGAITVTGSRHLVDTEGGVAATDDLETINGGSSGHILLLSPAHDARTVVIKHDAVGGNISCVGQADITMDDVEDFAVLLFDAAQNRWFALQGGGGAASFGAPGYPLDVAATEDDGIASTVPRADHVHAHGSGYLPDAHHPEAELRLAGVVKALVTAGTFRLESLFGIDNVQAVTISAGQVTINRTGVALDPEGGVDDTLDEIFGPSGEQAGGQVCYVFNNHATAKITLTHSFGTSSSMLLTEGANIVLDRQLKAVWFVRAGGGTWIQATPVIEYGALADIAAVAASGSAGTGVKLPRASHVHAHGSGYLPDAHHPENHKARHLDGAADAFSAADAARFGSVVLGSGVLDVSADLESKSTADGWLPPRMTTAQVNTWLGTPAASGGFVYDTDRDQLVLSEVVNGVRRALAQRTNYYNVRDFGAAGDGVADDTAEIQAAVDAANAAGGGVVYLPEGIYLVSGANGIQIKKQVVMLGEGAGTIIRQNTADGHGISSAGATHHRWAILNLQLQAGASRSDTSPAGAAIYVAQSKRALIDSIWVSGVTPNTNRWRWGVYFDSPTGQTEGVKNIILTRFNIQAISSGKASGATLTADITASATNISVSSTTVFGTPGAINSESHYIRIDNEVMRITAINSGTVLVVLRGQENTTGVSHLSAATLYHSIEAGLRLRTGAGSWGFYIANGTIQTQSDEDTETGYSPEGNYGVLLQGTDGFRMYGVEAIDFRVCLRMHSYGAAGGSLGNAHCRITDCAFECEQGAGSASYPVGAYINETTPALDVLNTTFYGGDDTDSVGLVIDNGIAGAGVGRIVFTNCDIKGSADSCVLSNTGAGGYGPIRILSSVLSTIKINNNATNIYVGGGTEIGAATGITVSGTHECKLTLDGVSFLGATPISYTNTGGRAFFVATGCRPNWVNTDHPPNSVVLHEEFVISPTMEEEVLTLWRASMPTTVTAQIADFPIVVPYAMTITELRLLLKTTPNGSVTFRARLSTDNGATWADLTTAGDITIASGGRAGSVTGLLIAVNEGDVLQVSITASGNTTSGINLAYEIVGRKLLTMGSAGQLGWGWEGGDAFAEIAVVTGHVGVLMRQTGAVSGVRCRTYLPTRRAFNLIPLFNVDDPFEVDFVFQMQQTTNVVVRIGIFQVADAGSGTGDDPPAAGIYFERLATDTNWFGVCRSGSVETRVDTGKAFNTAWRKLSIRRKKAGSGSSGIIRFVVNDDEANGVEVSANVPTDRMGLMFFHRNTAAEDKGIFLDAATVRIPLLARY
jgi:hypothetical protein